MIEEGAVVSVTDEVVKVRFCETAELLELSVVVTR